MSFFLQSMAMLLPMRIEKALWDGDALVLSAKGWTFTTESVWRVSKDGKVLLTCWDDCAQSFVSELLDLFIVEVSWLVFQQPIDPCFKLSDGRTLSVFCSVSTDPWIMEFSDGAIYVGNT